MGQDNLPGETETLRGRVSELEARLISIEIEVQRVRASEARYRQAVDESPDIIMALDSNGTIVSLNRAVQQITGWSPEEVLGRNGSFLIAQSQPSGFTSIHSRVFQGEHLSGLELEFRCSDGSMRRMLSRAYPVRDRHDNVVECILATTGVTRPKSMKDIRIVEQSRPEKLVEQRTANLKTTEEQPTQQIDKRKKVETSLRDREERLSLALEAANLGIWDWDLTTGEAVWAPGAPGMLGYGKGDLELDLKTWKSLVHPDDWPGVAEKLNLHIQGKLPTFDVEYRILTKYGDWKWVLGQGNVIEVDAEGKPTRMAGILADISDRKSAELALRESEERYRALFDNAGIGIDLLDRNGRILKVNRALMQMLGYTEEEFRRLTFEDITHPDDREISRRNLEALVAGEVQSYRLEKRYLRKDGSILWGDLSISTTRDASGQHAATIGVIADITERKRAEEALYLRNSAIESSISGISIADLMGNLTYVNPAALRLWGYGREQEILGRNALEFWHTDKEAHEAVTIAARTGSWIGELVARRKDGSSLDVQAAIALVRDPDGTPIAVMASFLDTLERKRAEAALRESEAKYRLLVESANELICVVQDGRFVFANSKALRDSGYSFDELTAMSFLDVVHPEDRNIPLNLYQEAMAGKEISEPSIFRVVDKLGRTRWGYTSLVRIDWKNRPAAMILGLEITDLKETEQALRESEARYRALSENAFEAIFLSERGVCIGQNLAAEKMFGYSSEEAVGRQGTDWIAPEHREIVRENIALDYAAPYEVLALRKDGSTFPCEIQARTIQHDERQIRVTSLRDITERKRAEEATRESEARLRLAWETVPDALSISRLDDGTCVDVNNGYTVLTGYSREEILGKSCLDITMWHNPASRQSFLSCLEREGHVNNLEAKIRRKDGTLRTVLISAGLMPLNQRPHVLAVTKDIEELHQTAEALRESEQRMRRLIGSSPVGIGIVQDGKYAYANPALIKMMGCDSPDDLLGRSPLAFIVPEDRDMVRQRGMERLEGRDPTANYQVGVLTKTGERFDASIWPTRFDYEGKPALLSFVADVTQENRLKVQLLQAQKLEAIGTLAGGVAHDFNNILQVVIGYSELLLAEEELPGRYRADLQKIQQSTRRGADLVQRLLTFSRKTGIKPQPLSLNYRIKEMRNMLERTIPKMIDMQLILGKDLATINVDPTQMDQILMNLAVNARDAMPEGGKLVFETANVVFDEEYAKSQLNANPGHYVLLTVKDTGTGMDQEALEHIFEPFYTTKGVGEGTGLGLAMVYGIVHQHGGHIRCYSEPGRGTTFKIYFPAIAADREIKDTPIRVMPRGGSETILLVDDEDLIRDLGSRILSKAGYSVLTASGGEEALEIYEQRGDEISLVLLDLIMPRMGGKKCLEGLLSLNPSIRVVIASGYSANGPIEDCLSAGATGFVNKPYDIRQVLEVVRKVLDSE